MANETQPSKNQAPNTEAKAPAQAKAEPHVEKRFLVKEDREIPKGSGTFLLRKGKTISSIGYDIQHLKRIGVKLEELPASA